MINTIHRPQKRLFITLILASLLVTSLSMYAMWKISFIGLSNISEYLPILVGAILIGILCCGLFGVLGIILAVLGLPTFQFFQKQAWLAINLLFPLAVSIGRLIDVKKERIERSFIEVSNQIIQNRKIKVSPDRLLLLTPHCLQQESCPHKITRNVNNCKKCGRCKIGELVALSEKLGFHFVVSTGGTLSRQMIKSIKPKAVLAIACERDLTSGIQDTYPLPVIGVLNERPCGPCNNTTVDIKKVEIAIKEFID